MPRVAPIVRSTRYEHAINTLVAKRAEISGAIRFSGANLADHLQHIDAVLLILGYKGDPSQITPLRRQPSRFRKGELYRLILKCEAEGSKANKETAQRIVQMKGWEPALVERVRQCVNTAKVRRRRKAKDSEERLSVLLADDRQIRCVGFPDDLGGFVSSDADLAGIVGGFRFKPTL